MTTPEFIRASIGRMGLAALCAAAALAGGCKTAHLAVAPGLAEAAQPMAVEGRQGLAMRESFRFGPYQVYDVRRGPGTSTTVSGFGLQSQRGRARFRFTMRDGEGTLWGCECVRDTDRKGVELQDFPGSGGTLQADLEYREVFTGTFRRRGGEPTWRLLMVQTRDDAVLHGTLTDGEEEIAVTGSRQLEGSSWGLVTAAGYAFTAHGRDAGAVEVINAGTVWLDPMQPAETKAALGAASSALLLYRDIRP